MKDPNQPNYFKPAKDAHTLYIKITAMRETGPYLLREDSFTLRDLDELMTRRWDFAFPPVKKLELREFGVSEYIVDTPPGSSKAKLPPLVFNYRLRKTKHADLLRLKNV